MKLAAWFSVVIGLSVVTACGGSTQSAGSGGSAGVSGSQLVGTWSGYVENYKFADQTDAITLTITNAQGAGQLAVGTAAPPPPPTDPSVGYPPGAPAQQMGMGGVDFVL